MRCKGCYLVNGDARSTAPRTNQILIEALMRGYSAWRGTKRRGMDRRKTARERCRAAPFSPAWIILLRLRAAMHSDAYSSHVPLPRPGPKQQLLLFPGAATFAILSFPLFRAPSHQETTFSPSSPPSARNAHNYEHVTRLISCLEFVACD